MYRRLAKKAYLAAIVTDGSDSEFDVGDRGFVQSDSSLLVGFAGRGLRRGRLILTSCRGIWRQL